jgi:formamidopyrimidine-DNA glycosylase
MPELPEVESVRRGLVAAAAGRRVTGVRTSGKALRGGSLLPLDGLCGRRIEDVGRHGKYLVVHLDDGATLLAHLGMSGRLLVTDPADAVLPHTHVVVDLDDGRQLRFVDPRRFGVVKLHPRGERPTELRRSGIDALDPALDMARLAALMAHARTPLKAFLLDQTRIAGVGNIYACEALWRARLSPRRRACRVPRARVAALLEAVVGTLSDAIADGGTSFRDYVDERGEPGRFMASLAVFQRAGLPCRRCARAVRRIVQGGRSTFYCPGCQR